MTDLWPTAISLLVQVSLILLAGVMLQQVVARSAAAKYGVLLWTLLAVAFSPALAFVFRAAGVQPLALLGNPALRNRSLKFSNPIAPLVHASASTPPNHFSFTVAFLSLWAAGALWGIARLIASWRIVRRLRRAATSLPLERITYLLEPIRSRLGHKELIVLFSESAGAPMTIGCRRPVVLLPPLVLDLDDRQLSHVLMHECAHAIRRDGLVGLFQRLISAALWFHPLIYLANRLIDRAREEICDNYVLCVAKPRDYSNTLLAVAKSISLWPDARLAPSFCHPAWSLEDRVAGLLNSRRSLMTKLTPKASAMIAGGFICGAFAFSCLAGAPQNKTNPQGDFSHVIRMKKTYSKSGDTITVEEVRGPAEKWIVGDTYEVTGTYQLASHDKALLAAFVTIHTLPDIHSEPSPEQMVIVSKGTGRFTLRFRMWQEGDPHVSFYPAGGGNSFGGVYF